jgi:hypothetical protein
MNPPGLHATILHVEFISPPKHAYVCAFNHKMEIPKLSTFVASKAAVRIMYICNRRVGGMILVWCEDGIE